MALIAIFGAGILVGTAMLIVLPEAIGVVIEADSKLSEIDTEHDESVHDHDDEAHVATIISPAITT